MGLQQPARMTGHSLLMKGGKTRNGASFCLLLARRCRLRPPVAGCRSPKRVTCSACPRPTPRADACGPAAPEPPIDLTKARARQGAGEAAVQRGTAAQRSRPNCKEPARVASAKQKSEHAGRRSREPAPETDRHRRAHRKPGTGKDRPGDPRSPNWRAEDAALTAGFASDRISVTKLLAILERLQHDMPPALAVQPDDALAAARGAMLVGASCRRSMPKPRPGAAHRSAKAHAHGAGQPPQAEAANTAAQLTTARASWRTSEQERARSRQAPPAIMATLKARLARNRRQGGRFPGAGGPGRGAAPAGAAAPEQSIVTVTASNPGPWAALPKVHCCRPWWEPWCRPSGRRQPKSGPYLCHPAGRPGDRPGRRQGSFRRSLP